MLGRMRERIAILALVLTGCSSGTSPGADARDDTVRPETDDATNDATDGGELSDVPVDPGADGPDGPGDVPDDDGGAAEADVPAGPPAIKVLLLAGQSNMVGLGRLDELPAELATPDTEVLIHAEGQLDAAVAGAWRPLAPGFGVDASRFGPELTAGLAVEARHPGVRWALIKHSIGGTSLAADWDPASGPLYASFREHVPRALAELAAYGPAEVVGLLWMQGESDALTSDDAAAYQARLGAFLGRVREELRLPTLPVVLGLISTDAAWVYQAQVRAAQGAIAAATGQVEVIETADLPRDFDAGDQYHYDTTGQLELGRRFIDGWAALWATHFAQPADFSALQGERNWFYFEWSGTSYAPLAWETDRWRGTSPTCLIAAGAMHPDAAAAELVWVVPASGTVSVRGEVQDADTSCGDGVRVTALLGGTEIVWGPLELPGSDAARHAVAFERHLPQHTVLGFRTEALGNPLCDTTGWSLALDFAWDER
jgi:hypothetical protein